MEKVKEKKAKDAIVITRTFNAPLELVWDAWSKPEHYKRWWGPEGFTCPYADIDFRKGGKYLSSMRASDGNEYWGTGEFREIIPLKKIVYTDNFADDKGNIVSGDYYGMEGDWSKDMFVTITFEEVNGKTKMILQHEGLPAGEHSRNAKTGWEESLNKMERFLSEETAKKNPAGSDSNYGKEIKPAQLNPYLLFNYKCEEAFDFYRSVFGGEFQMKSKFKEMPGYSGPATDGERIMHIALPLKNGSMLMGSDSPGDDVKITAGNNVSISFSADSEAEAEKVFNGLSNGGQVTMPLEKTFWNAYFGMCIDKYGVNWMVGYDYKS
jgi:uncharacterized glyoxalase superfamily protein PhnB/uncharacterized protein YndB with AHSA1/START domain